MRPRLYPPADRPRLPRCCPACGRRLEWQVVHVDRGADGPAPGESFTYADCACGLAIEWARPLDDAERDEHGADIEQGSLWPDLAGV